MAAVCEYDVCLRTVKIFITAVYRFIIFVLKYMGLEFKITACPDHISPGHKVSAVLDLLAGKRR
jgi:hypothetical protein